MRKAIIHIGFGKTGTSSLQSFLSKDVLTKTPYEYCAIEETGEVLSSVQVASRASKLAFGYVASTHDLGAIDDRKVRTGLEEIYRTGKIPILSQEHWSEHWSASGRLFAEHQLLEQWGIEDAHVIAYVRPQVDYLNSGWWQWWAWSGRFRSPLEVVEKWGTRFLWWQRSLESWASLPQVGKLSVRLHGRDTVSDFLSVLGVESTVGDTPRKNTAMSRELIQLYNALPGLRSEHGSELDSLLSSYVDGGKTPWSVPSNLARHVIRECREGNLALLSYLPVDQRLQMEGDAKWWSPDAYGEPEEVEPLCLETAVSVLAKIVPKLVDLSRHSLKNRDD